MVHEADGIRLGTHAQLPAGPATLLAAAARCVAEGASYNLDITENGRPLRVFFQHLAPPPLLLICGAGPDAQPLVASALGLGWRVTVVDHRPAYAAAERFPGATVQCSPAESLRQTVDLSRCHAAVARVTISPPTPRTCAPSPTPACRVMWVCSGPRRAARGWPRIWAMPQAG